MKLTLFYITNKNLDSAKALGLLAIEKKLAGCANFFPIQSVFPWQDKMSHEEEFVLILKTLPLLKESLQTFISENHLYDVPCIISFEVDVNEEYGKWISENTGMYEHE